MPRSEWDFRTGSPQRVLRALGDEIEAMGYTIVRRDAPNLKGSPSSDIATYRAGIRGVTQHSHTKRWPLAAGLALFLAGMVLEVIGLVGAIDDGFGTDKWLFIGIGFGLVLPALFLVKNCEQKYLLILVAELEGEAYKASAMQRESAQALDVVSDTRLRVYGGLTDERGDAIEAPEEKELLQQDLNRLADRVEAMLPSFTISTQTHT